MKYYFIVTGGLNTSRGTCIASSLEKTYVSGVEEPVFIIRKINTEDSQDYFIRKSTLYKHLKDKTFILYKTEEE